MVTYQSGENQSQFDYIQVKQQNIKLVHDVKVIPNEEFVTQHKLPVCDARIAKVKIGVKNLYQNSMYGISNRLIFMISFVNLLQMKYMTFQVSR